MKKFHPFYSIGTFGIIISAVLHMIMAWGLSLTQVNSAFFILYSSFATFLILGIALTVKDQKN
ncbi:MAG: hypothetical protein ACOH1O_00220 [Flavobacterium sp.]